VASSLAGAEGGTREAPQLLQNLLAMGFGREHDGQSAAAATGLPQPAQNAAAGGFSMPQWAHALTYPSSTRRPNEAKKGQAASDRRLAQVTPRVGG
jgi:hypothetical protein